MSVDMRGYVVLGIKFPDYTSFHAAFGDPDSDASYDALEPYYNVDTGLGVVSDGMGGKYVVVGDVKMVGDDDAGGGFGQMLEVETPTREERGYVAAKIRGILPEPLHAQCTADAVKLLVFTHYS